MKHLSRLNLQVLQIQPILLLSLLSGCATTVFHPADPLEKFNRGIFAFNKDVDNALLKPLAETYKNVTPKPIDQGITNFFNNIGEVVIIANDLLQLKFDQAASDTSRLLVNSTAGLLGVVDIASQVGLTKNEEDFGQTLGYWGLGNGPYLVLPFLGPSSIRDTLGRSIDVFFDPRSYTTHAETRQLLLSTGTIKIVDMRADMLGVEEVLGAAALDEYAYVRDAYLQRRDFLVNDGQISEKKQEALDELFDDVEEESISIPE
jgi:phospholipid-binding lipoprotein MlaA